MKIRPVSKKEHEHYLKLLEDSCERVGALLGVSGEEVASSLVENTSSSMNGWYQRPLEERLTLMQKDGALRV